MTYFRCKGEIPSAATIRRNRLACFIPCSNDSVRPSLPQIKLQYVASRAGIVLAALSGHQVKFTVEVPGQHVLLETGL